MIHSSFWGVSSRGPSWSQGPPRSVGADFACSLHTDSGLSAHSRSWACATPGCWFCRGGAFPQTAAQEAGARAHWPAPCRQERGTRGRALLMSFHSPQRPAGVPLWGFLVCVCLPSAWGDGDMHISRGGNVCVCARVARWGCMYTNGDSGTCGRCVYSKGLLVPFSV